MNFPEVGIDGWDFEGAKEALQCTLLYSSYVDCLFFFKKRDFRTEQCHVGWPL